MKLAANNDFFQKEASSENWLFFLEQLFFGMSWKYEDVLTLFLTQFTLVEFLTHASKVTKIVWHAKEANWLT